MTVRRDTERGWVIDFLFKYPDGTQERVRKKSPVQSRRGAEAYERELTQELLDAFLSGAPERKEVPRFSDFADEFMSGYVRTNNKPSEVQGKESILRVHLRPVLGQKRLNEIGVREIERLKASLLAHGLAKKTVNNILAVLSKILAHAVEVELLEQKPKIRLLKVPPQKFDFLSFEEYDQLLAVLHTEPLWGSAIITAGETGLRLGEILGLHWEDVNQKAKTITVRRSLWNGILGAPKGGKERTVPLTQRLLDVLRRQKHLKGDFVWSDENGNPLNTNMAEYAIRRACRRAGLREIGWHVLRHSYCSHLACMGAAPKAIQELAGHRNISTTMRYMHLAPTALVEAVGLLDARRGVQIHGTPVAQGK